MKALDAKEAAGGTLTKDERVERGERQGAEYARLDQAHRNGLLELSDEDTAKYKAYNDAHEAGIAKQQAALEALHEAAQKAEEIRRDPLKNAFDQFEKENPTFVQDQQAIEAAQKAAAEAAKKAEPMEATSRCPEPGTLPAVATAKAPEGVDSMGAIGDILRKEKMKEALTTMFTPEQLAQNVADAEYKKTPSYQVQQELLHIKHRTLEMQGMAEAQKNTPEWRKELMDLHQAHERLGVFDPEWRERQAIAGAAGMIGSLAAVAPQLTYRMALGHFAGKAMTEGLLHSAQTESDVAMAHLVGFCVDLAVGSHMPAGGLIARGAALTTKAATAESGGVLNRLREAGKDLAQWRPDPHAMGSGFVPLTRKAPAAATTALETATGKTTVAEAGVSEAPLSIHGNDLRSKKPNHIYKITEDGVTYKFGESGQGLKKRDGLSKRAEQQVRKLRKADPDSHYESKILRTYPDKATAKKFETKIIEKRKAEDPSALPGNKSNH